MVDQRTVLAPICQVRIMVAEGSRVVFEDVTCIVEIQGLGPEGSTATICAGQRANLALVHSIQGTMKVQLEIGAGACVDLDASIFVRPTSVPLQAVFASGGTGCLSAAWTGSARTSPTMQIGGMMEGDKLNLCYLDDVGAPHMLDSLVFDSQGNIAQSFVPPAATIAPIPLRLVDSSQIGDTRWVDDALPPCRPLGILVDPQTETGEAIPLASDQIFFCGRVPHSQRPDLAPVTFAANALAPGQPAHPIALAPWQHVSYQGMTVSAHQLVNGKTITQEARWQWLRYIVSTELATNSCDIAGLSLMPHTAPWPYPSGARAEMSRQHLLDYTARVSGASLVSDPALRLDINGQIIYGSRASTDRDCWRFELPASVEPGAMRLISRSAIAKETSSLDLADRRMLGVALRALIVHANGAQRTIDIFHADWSGVHAPSMRHGLALRWTNGLASLPYPAHRLQGGETLEVRVGASISYWQTDIDEPAGETP